MPRIFFLINSPLGIQKVYTYIYLLWSVVVFEQYYGRLLVWLIIKNGDFFYDHALLQNIMINLDQSAATL